MSDLLARGVKALRRIHQRNTRQDYIDGLLGRHNPDDTVTYVVTGRKLYKYVTVRQANGAQTVLVARDDAGVPHTPDLPVRMRIEGTTHIIERIIRREDIASSPAPPASGVPIHRHSHGDLSGLGDDDHPQYHNDTRGDIRYYTKAQHIDESAGAADAAKPIILDADGLIDASMLPDSVAIHQSYVTDWSYRSSNRNTGTQAWKGNEFTPNRNVKIAAICFYGTIVASATYQAAIVTATGAEGTPGTIATIVKSQSKTVGASPASLLGGWLWLFFDTPQLLTAGTIYGLMVGRTDSTDAYALPIPINGGTAPESAVPMAGSSHGHNWRIAKAVPVAGDAITHNTADSVSQGFYFMYPEDDDILPATAFADVIVASPEQTTLEDANRFPLTDDGVLKWSLWSTIKSAIKSYYDSVTATMTNKTLTTPTIADFTNAQHDHGDADDGGTLASSAIAATMHAATLDTAPLDADEVPSLDSSASFGLMRTTWTNIKAFLKTYFDTLYVAVTGAQSVAGVKTFSDGIKIEAITAIDADGVQIYDKDGNIIGVFTDDNKLILGASAIFRSLGMGPFHVESIVTTAIAQFWQNTNDALGPRFVVGKTRGTAVDSNTVVADGDVLGAFHFYGGDGTALSPALGAKIEALVDGTPGGNDMPAKLELSISPDGSNTPSVRLRISNAISSEVLQPVLAAIVQRLTSTATNDDPTQDFAQGRAATTNNTQTTLFTMAIPASHACYLEAHVVGRRTGGASGAAEDCAAYVIRGLFNQVAGAAAVVGQTQNIIGESQAGWDCVFDVTGTDARVRVTGATSNNISWHCHVFHRYLSS